MSKPKDLSRNFSKLPTAEQELQIPMLNASPGENVGGVSMYGNSLRRGSGDEMFGVDERGLWLGAADFDNALFRVSMLGLMNLLSQDGKALKISAEDNEFIVNDGTNDIIHIGYQEDGY